MLSDEEIISLNRMKLFARSSDLSVVTAKDMEIVVKLVENLQKDIENWKKYCDEQENAITLKNNKICDLEFKIEKQSKEIEELKEKNKDLDEQSFKYTIKIASLQTDVQETTKLTNKKWEDKIKAKIEELDKQEKEVLKGTKGQDRYAIKQEYMHKRSVLQSLLEKE